MDEIGKKTKWNNVNNDNENTTNESENFQVMNMQYKIKKIKDKKHKKCGDNYKNIPLFETILPDTTTKLDNNGSSAGPNTGPSAGPSAGPTAGPTAGPSAGPSAGPNAGSSAGSSIIQSAFDKMQKWFEQKSIETFGAEMPRDFEGCGEGLCDGKKTSINFSLADWIEYIYQCMLYINQWLAACILIGCTENFHYLDLIVVNPSNLNQLSAADQILAKEILLISNYIALLEGVFFSSYSAYNWFYILFVASKNEERLRPYKFAYNAIYDYKNTCSLPIRYLINIFMYLFEFAIFYPIRLNDFLINYFPKSKFLGYAFCFFFIFFFCLYTSVYSIGYVKNVLVDMAAGKVTPYTGSAIAIFVILFIFGVIADTSMFLIKNRETIKPLLSSTIPLFIFGICLFLYHIMRGVITGIISVPFGFFMCASYFISYSLFGMFIYSERDLPWNTFMKIYDQINSLIKNTPYKMPDLSQDKEYCKPIGMWAKFVEYIKNIVQYLIYYFMTLFDFLYNHIFVLAYICVLLSALVSFFTNISRTPTPYGLPLNDALVLFVTTIIVMILMFLLPDFFSYISNIGNETTNVDTNPDIIDNTINALTNKDKPILNSIMNGVPIAFADLPNELRDEMIKLMGSQIAFADLPQKLRDEMIKLMGSQIAFADLSHELREKMIKLMGNDNLTTNA